MVKGEQLLFSFFDKVAYRLIFYLFVLFISFILILNIFFSTGFSSIDQTAPVWFNWVTLIAAIALVVVLFNYRDWFFNKISHLYNPYLVSTLLLTSVIFQLIIVQLFNVNPSWDFKVLIDQANILAGGGGIVDYFVQYPNNLFIVLVLGKIGEIFGSGLYVYQYFNILMITISQYFIYRMGKKILGKEIGIIILIICSFFFPFIFYAPIVYTDTTSLLFVILPLNLLFDGSGRLRKDWLSIASASVLFAIGYLIKGSLVIFSIAMAIVLFLSFKKWKRFFFIVPLIVVILIKFTFNTYLYETKIIDRKAVEKYSFPVTHWIMMGQNWQNYGMWSGEDVNFTYQLLHQYPRKEVSKRHLEEVKNRFKERGLIGSLEYNIGKLKHEWTDGTYYSLKKLSREPVNPNHFVSFFGGKSGLIVQSFARIEHLLILFGLALFALNNYRSNNEFNTFGMLSLIGFFLFFLIWEARSRYILSLTPVLILLSSIGYYNELTKWKVKRTV